MNEEKQVAEVTEKKVSVNADNEKTKISKYYLEYRFIPYIVSRFNQKDENPKLWYLCMTETDSHKNCGSRRECRSLDEFKKQIVAHYDGTDERYYGDEDSGKWKKNLRKSLIYAIFAIFVGLCVAVAL